MVATRKAVVNTAAATGTSRTCTAENQTMNNPLRALAKLFSATGQPPTPLEEIPPPATENEPAIKVQVPSDVAKAAEAAAIKPKLPRESFKQHNREIEQRVKTANQHRPAMITRGMPHVRGR